MSPEDPRHGRFAGYQAHWNDGEESCAACTMARYRYQKRLRLEAANGVRMHYAAAEVRAVLSPWLNLGFSLSAISVAAGLESQRSHKLATLLEDDTRVIRSTYHALAGITEDDFAPHTKVYADLTRRRIYSLMAAGHRLVDMPVNPSGHWRTRSHISAQTARLVREHYRQNEFKLGSDRYVQSRARNAGHLPPLSWDDPGTLAWPDCVPVAHSAKKDINPGGGLPWRELLAEWEYFIGTGMTRQYALETLGVTEDAIRNAERKRAKAEQEDAA